MGSVSDMNNTQRALAIIEAIGDGGGSFGEFIGQTVEIVDAGLEAELTTISGWVKIRLPNGEIKHLETGDVYEIVDEGVVSYALQDMYDEDELREAILEVLNNPQIDDTDRRILREELDRLHSYYE